MNHTTSAALNQLESELSIFYGAIAVLLEECYATGSGMRMLGLTDEQWMARHNGSISVKDTSIGRMLPVWARYAYDGVVSAGYDLDDMNAFNDGPLERLRDLLDTLDTESAYFNECIAAARGFNEDAALGGLPDLVAKVIARWNLDMGQTLSPGELALLANMNERSVRNAMGPGGELKVTTNGGIDSAEALRWLSGRRGFVPTQYRNLDKTAQTLPDDLDAVELPTFVTSRLKAFWTPESASPQTFSMNYPDWIMAAARECDIPPDRLYAACRLPLDIDPRDCRSLAKVLRVEVVWFTHQVMTAMYPDQMDMLLNPSAWADDAPTPSTPLTSVTITLTDAMLANGYIDIPTSASSLFPEDCFGTRATGDTGAQVKLIFGANQADTDIRKKSEKTISPRKRFGAWLNSELGARAGDRIRIEKTGDRQYTLSHITS
ncbi:hypothetical protein [Hydrogenophaga sp. OTU3427]|uniref:hypothetical protein n=1 Tax=Hydrogenophaga sp. OTU3427 TaxID=3043856 RepID=UPI00313C408D